MDFIKYLLIGCVVGLIGYGFIGTSSRVDEIKEKAPAEITNRGWEIVRYEGWQYGSFNNHGGKVWYHVQNTGNHNIQYRVYVTLWGGELHFTYGEPEKLNRFNVQINEQ